MQFNYIWLLIIISCLSNFVSLEDSEHQAELQVGFYIGKNNMRASYYNNVTIHTIPNDLGKITTSTLIYVPCPP